MKITIRTIVGLMLVGMAANLLSAADHPSKKLFDTKCASCHGKDLKGNATMAKAFKVEPAKLDLTSAESTGKKDDQLIAITSKGAGKMPAYEKSLKADEIKGLVSYIRSVAPAKEAPAAK
jgi:mono/diheme cytochrome c family protein